jgi:4-hydroxy-tetrahydrodipicolinate reductase
MGQTLAGSIQQQADLQLAGVWHRGVALDTVLADADVVIDFSLPDGTERVLREASARKLPVVCGVSGLNDSQFTRLKAASSQIPLVYDRNMSLGITVMERTVRQAAATLGQEYEITVSEVHHVHKKDSPSGTALKLGEAIADARGESGTGSIRFEAERRAEVPGDHEVTMQTATETLTFGHSVTTRQVFADGALRAARWVVSQPAGLYSMQDVLFGN